LGGACAASVGCGVGAGVGAAVANLASLVHASLAPQPVLPQQQVWWLSPPQPGFLLNWHQSYISWRMLFSVLPTLV
jgi:hypothetical protein